MRIDCPHCGSRDQREFTVLGDANPRRPDASLGDALEQYVVYAYERDNPAGPHKELWYHGMGCQAWLVVVRDTRTHAVLGVTTARAASPAEFGR